MEPPVHLPLQIAMLAYTEYAADPRVRREAGALAARGDQIDFLCLQDHPAQPRWEIVDGVNLCHLPCSKYQGTNALAYLFSYLHFWSIATVWLTVLWIRRRYRLIQVHTMPDFLIFAATIPRIFGCRLILDVHDLMPDLFAIKFQGSKFQFLIPLLHWQARLSMMLAHHVITVHEPYRQIIVGRGIPNSKVSVLLNVPDDRLFAYAPRQPRGNGEPLRLIYHGTVTDRYGVEVLVRAIALLHDVRDLPPLFLVILGRGEAVPKLRALVEDLHLQSNVYIHGEHVPVEKLGQLLAPADLALIPNLANAFTEYILPTKLMEYAALGIPAIVARTRVVSTYFTPDMVAYFTPGDATDLARQITQLARFPARRLLLAREAHERFTRRYNWTTTRLAYYSLIDDLCRSQPSQGMAAPAREEARSHVL
jgi:glycosyltransferase involved in cell wall biosynthesis